jgi:hypothetical protein
MRLSNKLILAATMACVVAAAASPAIAGDRMLFQIKCKHHGNPGQWVDIGEPFWVDDLEGCWSRAREHDAAYHPGETSQCSRIR